MNHGRLRLISVVIGIGTGWGGIRWLTISHNDIWIQSFVGGKGALPSALLVALMFYRPTLCVSTNYVVQWQDVCPSVTRRYCVETAKHIKVFHR